MKPRAQDITSLSLPFAAGTAAVILLFGRGNEPYGAAGVAVVLSLALLFLLMRGRLRSWTGLVLAMLFAGAACGLTGLLAPGAGPARAMAPVQRLIAAIPYPSASTGPLVEALLTGDRSGLSAATTASFRAAGAAHLLALSGLHLGILYLMLSYATVFLGRSRPARWIRYGILVGLSGLYAAATGASPSIVRAFLFILLGETARLRGIKVRPVQVFCGALTLQLIFAPAVIRTLGFQLSYLAMAGIVLVYPRLRDWYPADGGRLDLARRIWDGAALALSCQAFTAPLVWLRFGTFPRFFLLTNLLAMPLTTGLMVLSVAVVLLQALGICPPVLVVWNDALAQGLLGLLELIASL